MTDRPIDFNAPMIRTLLAGTKTQVRTVLKLPTKTASGAPIYERKDMGGWEPTTFGGDGCKFRDGTPSPEMVGIWHRTTGVCISAPVQQGDHLYVREAWRTWAQYDEYPPRALTAGTHIAYEATPEAPNLGSNGGKLRPGMHMPRWASRLTLVVADVRVQRLQDISEADAAAEGCALTPEQLASNDELARRPPPVHGDYWYPETAKGNFLALWCDIHGGIEAWDANPWVAAYTFQAHPCNIDQMELANGDPEVTP